MKWWHRRLFLDNTHWVRLMFRGKYREKFWLFPESWRKLFQDKEGV